jgi:hypothetical protein
VEDDGDNKFILLSTNYLPYAVDIFEFYFDLTVRYDMIWWFVVWCVVGV